MASTGLFCRINSVQIQEIKDFLPVATYVRIKKDVQAEATLDGVTRTIAEYEIPIPDLSRFTDYASQDDVVNELQRWMVARTFHATRTFEHDVRDKCRHAGHTEAQASSALNMFKQHELYTFLVDAKSLLKTWHNFVI